MNQGRSYTGAKLIKDKVAYLIDATATSEGDGSQFSVTGARVEREPKEDVVYELTTEDGTLDQLVKLIERDESGKFLFQVTD